MTIAELVAAGVTGTVAGNLAAYKTAIAGAGFEGANTTAKIQDLINGVNTDIEDAAAALALTNAEDAVQAAEDNKTQANVDTAQGLVTALADSAAKAALQDRIDAIDLTPPSIISIGLADSTIELYGIGDDDDLKIYFSENILVDTPTSITFQGDDGFNLIFTYVSHEGAEMIVRYTLEENVTPERIFPASYSVSGFVGGISDLEGNSFNPTGLVISSEVFNNNAEYEFFRSVTEIFATWDVIRPIFTSGITATATENGTITDYTVQATDENLPGAPFAINGGDDAALFEIVENGEAYELRFMAAPNFDTPGDFDGNNIYQVTLQVVDLAGNTATTNVSVTLTNDVGDDAPPAPPAPPAPAPAATSFTPSTPQTALVLTTSATSVGWGLQVKVTLTGGSGTGAITYSSTGSTLCAVDSNGNLTPVSVGTCIVTANKAGDGTYAPAQSNSITITATNAIQPTVATTSVVSMVVGKPVGGFATVRCTVDATNAGSRVSVVLGTKNSTGKIIYRTLGSATVTSTGVVTYKTRVKLPVGAVLQLRAPGSLILSRVIR
jgi:hypothetical protein